jgi:hypothetical protein
MLFPFWRLKAVVVPPVCPEGEQMVNGGFETGDSTGWTGPFLNIVTDPVHSGVYACELGYQLYMSQTLAETITVDCIESWDVWVYGSLGGGGYKAALAIIVTYTDATTTSWTEYNLDPAWLKIDILSHLESGKTVESIYFHSIDDVAFYVTVDDCSLIGKG